MLPSKRRALATLATLALTSLAGCAIDHAPNAPPLPPAVLTEPEVIVAPKFAPPPSIVAPVPVARRCDFTAVLAADDSFPSSVTILSPAAQSRLKDIVVSRLGECANLELVTVTGHTDRLGRAQANQTLSEKRAEAVKAALVKAGIPSGKINAVGVSASDPVALDCPTKATMTEQRRCLSADRRVVIEVKGTAR